MGFVSQKPIFSFAFFVNILLCLLPNIANAGITRHYKFHVSSILHPCAFPKTIYTLLLIICQFILQIQLQNVTRLCQTKTILTVNGQFPGPRIIAREGDRVLIKVVNHVQNNISLHW